MKEESFNNWEGLETLLSKKTVKSIFSYKDLIDDYKNEDLDYFKFLISSQIDKSFYSSNDDLFEFKKILKRISQTNYSNLSDESADLLNIIEKNVANEEDYKKLQKLFFKFDELTFKLRNLGERNTDILNNLPFYYKERYLSQNEKYRVEVFPSEDVNKKENLSKFVKDVQSVFPKATGMPVVQFYAGEVVINSFVFAMLISLTFLSIFIYAIFKKIKFVLLTLFCLFLGVLLSIFSMIIFKINFNFANMISLPLLFSLGVSYPIYFLKRFVELRSIELVIKSKTPSAIFLSAMTTICSFSTLAVSSHQGTSSMGILLFLSLTMTVISSMLFLPLILSIFKVSFK